MMLSPSNRCRCCCCCCLFKPWRCWLLTTSAVLACALMTRICLQRVVAPRQRHSAPSLHTWRHTQAHMHAVSDNPTGSCAQASSNQACVQRCNSHECFKPLTGRAAGWVGPGQQPNRHIMWASAYASLLPGAVYTNYVRLMCQIVSAGRTGSRLRQSRTRTSGPKETPPQTLCPSPSCGLQQPHACCAAQLLSDNILLASARSTQHDQAHLGSALANSLTICCWIKSSRLALLRMCVKKK